jgi:hypothetical protein
MNYAALEQPSSPPGKLSNQPRPLPPAVVLRLSWTHLLELIRMDDPWKRAFYENECLKGKWSKRQLQRHPQAQPTSRPSHCLKSATPEVIYAR